MQSTATPGEAPPSPVHAEDAGQSDSAGAILSRVFETLDHAGIRYCVTHGYEELPERVRSDIDGVIEPKLTPAQLVALLRRNSARIGAEIVVCKGYYLVLAGRNADGSPCFLTLDLSVDCRIGDVPYYAGAELLQTRRSYRQFWIPAADLAFGSYLVRSIAKACLDDSRTARLSRLYGEDPAGCEKQVARFWGARNAGLIISAARSGDWTAVRQQLEGMRAALRRGAILRRPARYGSSRLDGLLSRVRRLWKPDGVYLAVLGPDGAGKSSMIERLSSRLTGPFAGSTCYGFTPGIIHHLRHGPYRPNDAPHALPVRSYWMSVARAVLYWFTYYTLGYLVRHLNLARSILVLSDRHFVDVLVDPKRYRYGGPQWLVRLIWRLIPKPDLIVLLDAPAEVLQSRKQEVPFEETARQRRAYLTLVHGLRTGHVVDATRTADEVAAEVSDIVLRHLSTRVARRLALAPYASDRMAEPTTLQITPEGMAK